jgi:hypothetical protein
MFGALNRAGHNRHRLQSNYLIWHVASQSLVKVRETADWHIGNQLVRNVALEATLITTHQEDVLLVRDLGQTLSQRISLQEGVAVIFEEEHANYFGPMAVLLQLGKDHLTKLVRHGVALRRKNVRNFHW